VHPSLSHKEPTYSIFFVVSWVLPNNAFRVVMYIYFPRMQTDAITVARAMSLLVNDL